MKTRLGAAVSVAIAVQLVLHGTSHAQESGIVRMLQSYVSDLAAITHAGGKVTSGMLVGTNTVLESSGPPFVQDQAGLAKCFLRARSVQGSSVSLEATCTMTDADGDDLYLFALREEGDTDAGGGGAGVASIEGGTGKYGGIAGECTYDTKYLPDDFVVTFGTCTWERSS